MIAEELKLYSVGDWVRPNKNKSMQPFQISRIEDKHYYDSESKCWTRNQWSDLELTPEILLKNGFKEQVTEDGSYCLEIHRLHTYWIYVKKISHKTGSITVVEPDEFLYDADDLLIKRRGFSIREFQNFLRFCGFKDIADNFKVTQE